MNDTKHFTITKTIINNGKTDVLGLVSLFVKIFLEHLLIWGSEVYGSIYFSTLFKWLS